MKRGRASRTAEYRALFRHWRYFSRECQRLGKEPTLQMPVVCEQFKILYPTRD